MHPVKSKYPSIQHVIPSIDRYVSARIPTGSFLEAVLSNDFKEACSRADHVNQYLIFDIVSYLWNEVPARCWGSPEKVQEWLAGRLEVVATEEVAGDA